ncbi:hypothetical protein [Vannielia sp. SX4]|uniref:hypothetical protein n=1 Tax=Vannielia sp. SX4 TaxID=3463852 RepID=UPI004059BABB
MAQQDFQARLARLDAQPKAAPATAAEPSAQAPARPVSDEPGAGDVARGLMLGAVASLGASMVEFHLWLGGDAMAYLEGTGAMVGIIAIMVIAYVLSQGIRARGFLGQGALVAGVVGEMSAETMLPEFAPGLSAALFNQQFVSLVQAGYSFSIF